MQYSDSILNKVKSFGVLQYDIDKIIKILEIADKEAFTADINNPEHIVYVMYHSGLAQGQYNLDAATYKARIAEAEKTQLHVDQMKKFYDLRTKLFGNG